MCILFLCSNSSVHFKEMITIQSISEPSYAEWVWESNMIPDGLCKLIAAVAQQNDQIFESFNCCNFQFPCSGHDLSIWH